MDNEYIFKMCDTIERFLSEVRKQVLEGKAIDFTTVCYANSAYVNAEALYYKLSDACHKLKGEINERGI